MSLPKQSDIEEPLLREIAKRGGEVVPSDLYNAVAKYFPQITSQDLSERTSSGANRWSNRVQFTRNDLVNKGEIDKSVRGMWRITEKGRKRIELSSSIALPTSTTLISAPIQAHKLAPSRHETLKKMIVDIGNALGYHTSTEEGPVYRHDVLWRPKGKPHMPPLYVIEVCEGGSLPKDFDSLHWALENWVDAWGLLVVTDDKDYQKASQRFINRAELYVVKAKSMEDLNQVIINDDGLLGWLLRKH